MRRRFLRSQLAVAVLVAMGLVPMLSGAAQAQAVGAVTADFYVSDLANTTLHIFNTSAFPLTNVTLTGTGYGPTAACSVPVISAAGDANGSRTLANIAAGGTLNFVFSDFEGAFPRDFADSYQGGVNYELLAVQNGVLVGANFSPNANATGTFVPFLGNDINGCDLPPAAQIMNVPVLVGILQPIQVTVTTPLGILGSARLAGAFTPGKILEIAEPLTIAAGATTIAQRCGALRCALCLVLDAELLNTPGTAVFGAELEAALRALIASGGCPTTPTTRTRGG